MPRPALVLLLLLLPVAARAQTDSVRAALARTPFFTPTMPVGAWPGAWVYRFDAPGWPEAAGLDGLPPHATRLRLGAVPFDDLITGRARFDLLPLAWLDTLARGSGGGRAAQVETGLRLFDVPRPRTEARYLSGPDGFQSIEALHAQSRRRRLLGRDGLLDVTFGYAGRAADNEYDNSRLGKGRATLARAGFRTDRARVEASNFHTRGYVGAPDGVLPVVPGDAGSIYDRFNATVRNPTAFRQTIRNDTWLHAQRGAAQVDVYRTSERFRYTGDSLATARAVRYGGAAALPFAGRQLDVEGWWQRAGHPTATAGRRARLYAGLRDTLAGIAVRAGAAYDGALRPTVSLSARTRRGSFHVEAADASPPPLVAHGFGVYARGRRRAAPFVLTGSATLALERGPWTLSARPFASHTWQGYDFVETARDTLATRLRNARRAGATLGLGWRDGARRGLYAHLQATATADVQAAFHDLPRFTTDNALGLRAALFQRDLRLDLWARLRGWSAFDGRVLHDPTGVLALAATPERVPASTTLDVNAVMGVRAATLFLAWENVLAGTALLRGNLIVPEQPLPGRRLRFGVFWPIFD